jgi:hypothetical protein
LRLTPFSCIGVQPASTVRPEYREATVRPSVHKPSCLFVRQSLYVRIHAQNLDAVAVRIAQSAASKEDSATLFAIQEFQYPMLPTGTSAEDSIL